GVVLVVLRRHVVLGGDGPVGLVGGAGVGGGGEGLLELVLGVAEEGAGLGVVGGGGVEGGLGSLGLGVGGGVEGLGAGLGIGLIGLGADLLHEALGSSEERRGGEGEGRRAGRLERALDGGEEGAGLCVVGRGGVAGGLRGLW